MADNKEFIAKLKRARALVARGWTQGVYARDANNNQASPCGKKACKWCASGALLAVGLKLGAHWEPTPVNGHGVTSWNDVPGRTQAEVLVMFDNSIAALALPDSQKREEA